MNNKNCCGTCALFVKNDYGGNNEQENGFCLIMEEAQHSDNVCAYWISINPETDFLNERLKNLKINR